MALNKPLKFVPATKNVASTGLANARRLAGRYIYILEKKLLTRIVTIMTILFCSIAVCAETIENASIDRLYIQSTFGANASEAHAIRINQSIDSSCNGRLYIEPEDSEMFSAILAYQVSERSFNLMYSTGAPAKTISGHLTSRCKVFSIY